MLRVYLEGLRVQGSRASGQLSNRFEDLRSRSRFWLKFGLGGVDIHE